MSDWQSFERSVCRRLSLWITDGDRDDVLWRNRLRKRRDAPDAKQQLGDIGPAAPEGVPFCELFNVEVKHGYSGTRRGKRTRNVPWDALDVIDSAKNRSNLELVEFWQQCTSDAEASGRRPLLVFKRDYHVPVACVDRELFGELELLFSECYLDTVRIDCGGYSLRMMNLDGFLGWVDSGVVDLLDARRG